MKVKLYAMDQTLFILKTGIAWKESWKLEKIRKWIDKAEVVQPIINKATTLAANHQ